MFHLNVADRLTYACRVLRKALSLGAKVTVVAPASTLAQFDKELWVFEARDFVPHVRVGVGDTLAPRLHATPVWLVDQVSLAPHRDALLNLGDDLVAGFESFARVIEVIPNDDEPKRAARKRWKHYADRGYSLAKHEAVQ